jgi:hypothetical protein
MRKTLKASALGLDQLASSDIDVGDEMDRPEIRLRASRLAAGYVVVADAASALGIPLVSYRSAEKGVVGLSDALIHAATNRFAVSPQFLRSGETPDAKDQLAARLVRIIMETDGKEDFAAEFAHRLRDMRLLAGFRQASDAARSKGWVVPTFHGHESGYNPITLDRQIGYALAFGYRPEYAVLGEIPKEPDGDEKVEWKDLRGSDEIVVGEDSSAWGWLRRAVGHGLPVLEIQGGRFKVLPNKLVVPSELLDTSRGIPEDAKAFCYAEPGGGGPVHLIDPLATNRRQVFVLPDGKVKIQPADKSNLAPTDPVRRRKLQSVTHLGGLVGRLKMTVDWE